MKKPALAVVEQEAIVSTEAPTVAEKLRAVLNEVTYRLGYVAINVTRHREDMCLQHKIKTLTMFDEKSAYRGPSGLWIMQFQGILYSPQAGEIPFNEWIEKSYSEIGTGKMTQPIGNFTRWN